MELFIKIVQFVFIISVLVILHELGHFIPAKYFKTKVEKFYLFFDVKFSLLKKKIGETVYGIGWLPLGGYVKIAGMIDESMDTEQMAKDPEPWEFRSKPAWQRLIIMLGGVIVNFLLAWFIYSTILAVEGDSYIPMDKVAHGIYADEVGEKLGLRTGDKIISVDGNLTKKYKKAHIALLLGDEALVLRDGKEVTVQLTDEGKKAVLESKGKRFLDLRREAIIGRVVDGYSAKKSGLLPNDQIKSMNGKPIAFWDEFNKVVKGNANKNIDLGIVRNGQVMQLALQVQDSAIVGVSSSIEALEKLEVKDEYTILQSIPAGFKETISVLTDQVKQFKLVFSSTIQGYKQMKGPIGIVEMMPAEWDWGYVWSFMAMFSVWLAFLNILPIPALDGGHVMFLLYEMISGRPPSEKVLERGQIIGFVILMGLMAIIFGNDIWNLIKDKF